MPNKKKTSHRRVRTASPAARQQRTAKISPSTRIKSASVRTSSRAAQTSNAGGATYLRDRLARYGILRTLLAMAGVLHIVFAVSPGVVPVYSGWLFVPTVLVPVLAPLVFMLLLLDALMCRVLMSDMHGAERARRRHAVTVNLLLVAGLSLRWLPYYLALGK